MNVIISNTNTNIYILQHRTKEGEENKITTNVNEMTSEICRRTCNYVQGHK